MSPTFSDIMRGPLVLLASLAVIGCDSGVSGTYVLVSAEGQEMPYSWDGFGTVVVFKSGTLALRDSTFELTIITSDEDGTDEESTTQAGTFTLSDEGVLCMTYIEENDPVPPPPPHQDTVSSTEPGAEALVLEPVSESVTECDARWDGQQIISPGDEGDWIFRR